MHILNVEAPVEVDESIISYQERSILPKSGTNYGKLGEIRFVIQSRDSYTHPSKSYLYIEGVIKDDAGNAPARTKLSNNGLAFLFESVRFEVNSVEIDQTRNVGITTTLKNYVSLEKGDGESMSNTGWNPAYRYTSIVKANGKFSACIPLSMLLGFMEDYQKILMCDQTLILTRSNTDDNCYQMINPITQANAKEECEITIENIVWKVPFVQLGDRERLHMYNILEKKTPLFLSFRSWELMEYPILPQTTNHIWNVRTTSQMEKPRYIIFGMQTARKNSVGKDATQFDDNSLIDFKIFLNEQVFPYDHLNLDFDNNHYSLLFEMYKKFQCSYYNKSNPRPTLSMEEFKTYAPIVVIDCTRQTERVKTGSVDVRVEFQSKNNIPNSTSCYCLIIHDRVFELDLFNNKTRKL